MFNTKYKKQDYLETDLPITRREQFKEILSSNFGTILLIGLCLLIFAIPYFALNIFGTYYLEFVQKSMSQNGSSDVAISDSIRLVTNIIRLLRIVTFIIFAIGLAGVSRVVRELCFSNGVLFRQDFFKGIKQNIKNFIITAILIGLLLFLVELFQETLISNLSKTASIILSGIAFGILFIVLFPINMFMLASNTIYDLPFMYNFINCSKLFVKNLFVAILFMIVPIGIKFLDFISYLYIRLSIVAILILFLLPIYIVGWHLFCLSNFDKYFNKDYYKEIYKKGLYTKDTKEESL